MIWFLKEFSKRLRSLDLLCPRAGGWVTAPSPKDGLPRVAQKVKNLPAMLEAWVRSLAWENPLKEEMATHCSILAWRIPQTEKPGGLQSMGSQRVGHDWATSTFPKRCPCPHTQNVLPLPAKKYLESVIKLRILKWVDYSGFFWWPIVITVVLIRGDRRVRVRDGDCNNRSRYHLMQPWAKDCGQTLGSGRGRGQILP